MAFGGGVPSLVVQPNVVAIFVNADTGTLTVGIPVYSVAAGSIARAMGDGGVDSKSLGITVTSAPRGGDAEVQTSGIVTLQAAQWDAVCGTSGGLAHGQIYYLSTTVPGVLVTSSASACPVLRGISPTTAVLLTPFGSGGGGTLGTGTTNALPVYSSSTSVGPSTSTDDGFGLKVTTLRGTIVNPTVLGPGPVDLDPGAAGMVIDLVCASENGSILRSMKTLSSDAAANGEIRIIRNNTDATTTNQGCIFILQDDPNGLYSPFHISAREPWLVIPTISSIIVMFDPFDGMWHPITPTDFQTGKRPRQCTPAVMSTGNVNDYNPTDVQTGQSHQWFDWMRLQPVSGTRLTGFDAAIAFAGNNQCRRILLTNYGVQATIAHDNNGGGTSTFPIFCPGATNFTWRAWASVWMVFDVNNSLWVLEGV